MKGFIKGVTDAATQAEQAFEKAVTKAAQRLADPKSVPQSDVDDAWREFRENCKKIETNTSEAARTEIKEHITLKEAEELIEDGWVKTKKLADKGIKAAPKAWNWIKTALCVVGAGIAAVSFGLLHPPAAYQKGLATQGIVNKNNTMLKQEELNLKLAATQEDFLRMGNDLNIPGIPIGIFTPPNTPIPAARYIPPPIILPVAVAPIAAHPVQVEIDNGDQVSTGTTTVEALYRAVPQARARIEQVAPAIEHGYNQPTDWAGMVHRVFEGGDSHEQQLHVNINVNAGFASANFQM